MRPCREVDRAPLRVVVARTRGPWYWIETLDCGHRKTIQPDRQVYCLRRRCLHCLREEEYSARTG